MKQILLAAIVLVCCGCLDPSAFQTKPEETAAPAPPPAAAPPAAEPDAAPGVAVQPAAAAQGANAIPDVEAVIVDKQKAMAEKPGYVETETKINAGDPLSAATQSYFALGQRVQLLNFKHNIDLYQAANERYPTYDEFIEMFRQFDVKMKMLKPWQVYAYDQTDGTMVVLEDREEKKRRYEAAGIEYTE
jgi:hypothetical protein